VLNADCEKGRDRDRYSTIGAVQDSDHETGREACEESGSRQVGGPYLAIDEELPGRSPAGGEQPAERFRERLSLGMFHD
jgi:hypothetical protein